MPPTDPVEIINSAKIRETGESIADLQLPSGMIPWFPNGHADPWNHIEAAMALDVAGLHDEAESAYQWLADIQLENGSWHNYYLENKIEQHIFTDTIYYEVPKLNTSALYLHGDQSYIQCPNNIQLNKNFTIHMSFKPDEIIPEFKKMFDEYCVFSIEGWYFAALSTADRRCGRHLQL